MRSRWRLALALLLVAPVLTVLIFAQEPPEPDERAGGLALRRSLAANHGAAAWRASVKSLQGRLRVCAADRSVTLEAALWLEAGTQRSRLDVLRGPSLVYDGAKFWISPAESPFEYAAFHALFWPMSLRAPSLLSAEAAEWKSKGGLALFGQRLEQIEIEIPSRLMPLEMAKISKILLHRTEATPQFHGFVASTPIQRWRDAPQSIERAVILREFASIELETGKILIPRRGDIYEWPPKDEPRSVLRMSFELRELKASDSPPGLYDKPGAAREIPPIK